ncbi:MAG: hypothetical protein EBY61_10550, partial [Actinobacteria bacterium]|nr:hypothetical protein [Actinomycetota bacterium]
MVRRTPGTKIANPPSTISRPQIESESPSRSSERIGAIASAIRTQKRTSTSSEAKIRPRSSSSTFSCSKVNPRT